VGGGDIIVRLKEGQETPPGTKIYSLKGFDADGDRLLFGVQKGKDSDLIKVVNQVRFKKCFENLPKCLNVIRQNDTQQNDIRSGEVRLG
jgi:hypothetical protein